jgi:hypothetical protein
VSYAKLSRRIASLCSAKIIGYVGTEDARFPFYCLKKGRGKKVLLLGSVHGDEPAGAEAITHFFEEEVFQFENDFQFTAFPCVNPWGYEHFSRYNGSGLNINREFKIESPSEEIRLMQPHLDKYVAAIDFHETMRDWQQGVGNEPDGQDPEEFYLWEICADRALRAGRKIVSNVEAAGYSVCKWPKIYGDKNNDGVIWYPEDCGTPCYAAGTASDSFLAEHHTPHAFTIETYRGLPIQDRVAIDMIVLRTILESKRA